ncbi:HAD family phosphatase [Rhabdobacter roseus]|uniref:Putative hydrolase of the HAD superfamily n=1 Tax=Rhabdobacter roseus TaxID=1655419 RepID=A0A840TUP1_9BACT|nr:HAD family hydrolase [Rhabdobacter roseus]MBB5286625.1 putative hydrolase of the HAD superfamily [Rhabdobacter roseus]
MVKGVLIDYGGTIDTNGLHWGAVLWDSYQRHQLPVEKADFALAYAFGERSLALHPIIQPQHTFYDTLYLKTDRQFAFLREKGYTLDDAFVGAIARDCDRFAQETVAQARPTLAALADRYPLVLVSNFYGNINTVLEVFEIRSLFRHVVESAVVGIRKPNPAIYRLGADLVGLPPQECVVIGDSFAKDIVPAKELGCRTLWLKVQGWEEPAAQPGLAQSADVELTDFSQSIEAIRNLNQ